MEAMRQSWTDDRLDDFRGEVNRRFDEVDQRLGETNKRIDDGFARVNDRLDSLQRVLFQAAVALSVGLLGALAALVVVLAQH